MALLSMTRYATYIKQQKEGWSCRVDKRGKGSGEMKKEKYAPLQEEGKANGWKVKVWAVEVACYGFPASSMSMTSTFTRMTFDLLR